MRLTKQASARQPSREAPEATAQAPLAPGGPVGQPKARRATVDGLERRSPSPRSLAPTSFAVGALQSGPALGARSIGVGEGPEPQTYEQFKLAQPYATR